MDVGHRVSAIALGISKCSQLIDVLLK